MDDDKDEVKNILGLNDDEVQNHLEELEQKLIKTTGMPEVEARLYAQIQYLQAVNLEKFKIHETKIKEIDLAIGEICSIQQDVQTHQIENNNKSNIEKFEVIKTRINEMTDILNANGSAINNLETKINEMTDILNANGEVINTQKTDYIVLQSKINSMIDDMNSFASVGNDQIGKITNLEEGVTQIVDQLNTMSVRVRLIGKTINIRETLEKESFNLLMGGNVGSDSEKTPEEQKATDEHNEYLKKLYEREAERIFADDDDDEKEATEPDSNEETRK